MISHLVLKKLLPSSSRLVMAGLLCLTTSVSAQAEDGNLAVVGPDGHSSMSLMVSHFDYRNDQTLVPTHVQRGEFVSRGNTMALSGIYAINDRVDISANFGWMPSRQDVSSWNGSTHSSTLTSMSKMLELRSILVENKEASGFKLIANASAWHNDRPNIYSGYAASIQPQYRMNKDLLLSLNLGMQHEKGSPNSQSMTLAMLWKIAPKLSISPSVTVSHVESFNTFSDFDNRTIDLWTTYDMDAHWSFYSGISLLSQTRQTSNVYINSFDNGRSFRLSLGVRRRF